MTETNEEQFELHEEEVPTIPLSAQISAALFVNSKPLSLAQLAEATNYSEEEVEEVIERLVQLYQSEIHGVYLSKVQDGYQLRTAPGALPWFLPFLGGLLLAIPFAVITSSPLLGALAVRWKILALPEEVDTPPELAAVLPWLPRRRETTAGLPDEAPHAVPVIVPARQKR